MKRDHLLCGVLLIICLHAPNQGSRDRRDALSYRIACRYNLLEICSRAHLPNMLTRRGFLTTAALGLALGGFGCHGLISGPRRRHAGTNRIFFVSQGRTALINADGSGLRYLRLDAPNQVTWQPADFFTDGRRILFLSMEPRRDGPGRPFDEYYTQTPTHLWIYDLDSGSLKEIATRDRLAVFYTPQLLLNDERMLVQVVRNKIGQIFSMNLDGTDQREFTRSGEGLPYGFDLSPDQQTVAFHLASPAGYQIWTSDLEGRNRTLIAAHRDRLDSSARSGRLTDNGSLINLVISVRIRPTIGRMFASAVLMAAGTASSRTASHIGLAPVMAIRRIAAVVRICSLGPMTAKFCFLENCPAPRFHGSIKRSGRTPITSTASSNQVSPAEERKSAALILPMVPSHGSRAAIHRDGTFAPVNHPTVRRFSSVARRLAQCPPSG